MEIAAYCRVSTDKADQINSLESQKEFFTEYAEKYKHTLVEIYADEGITGTSTKKRKEFQRMMEDAKRHKFEMLVVKDVSRLARNTVDFLGSVRTLKDLGISTYFITIDKLISPQNKESELTITILAATAQEESGNTSKRVKFGKRRNAEKGRVPNIIYGYDKIKGDYFNLTINEEEAKYIRMIFDWYVNEGDGAARIAFRLNKMGVKTKRNCVWYQESVCTILRNPIYAGIIYNGKQEVEDFLTGKRINKTPSEWLKAERPELRIIDDETFQKAQEILSGKYATFNMKKERRSNRHLFSTLIKCGECGYSFRRFVAHYGNHPVSWICSGRNIYGTGYCSNVTKIPEETLIEVIDQDIQRMLEDKRSTTKQIIDEFRKKHKINSENVNNAESVSTEIERLKKQKEKVNVQFECDSITEPEFREKISSINSKLRSLNSRLELYSRDIDLYQQAERLVEESLRKMEAYVSIRDMNNAQLKQIIEKIIVTSDERVNIYYKVQHDLGLDDDVLVCNNRT